VAPTEQLDAYVELELLASSPYVDFVYGGADAARPIHRRLVERGVGEFAAPFGRLAIDANGDAVGMIAGPLLGPKELNQARFRAAAALAKDPDFSPSCRAQATATRGVFLALEDGDAYLSRIAVASSARGRGVGRTLLARFLDDCRARSARRAVLEVSSLHEAAAAMYQKAGFTVVGESAADESGRPHYRHLALAL
jgi:ribosomal protein S18 acetylase RimI-like enzyme